MLKLICAFLENTMFLLIDRYIYRNGGDLTAMRFLEEREAAVEILTLWLCCSQLPSRTMYAREAHVDALAVYGRVTKPAEGWSYAR